MRGQGIGGLRGVRAGSCYAWPLPPDATCATVARQVIRDAVSEIGLEPDLLDDCVLMASELAANTLHARAVAGSGGGGDRLVSVAADMGGEPVLSAGPAPQPPGLAAQPPGPVRAGGPELWLYLRGVGIRRELVCKIFDGTRIWRHGSPAPGPGPAANVPAHAVTGRGLHLVRELSRGRWGHHLSRPRLSDWGLSDRRLHGKAVWFSVPAPLAHAKLVDVTGLRAYTLSADVTADRAYARLSARQAAQQVETMLAERGFGHMVRADQPAADLAVLSVCRGLTVWCRSGTVALTRPGGREEWSYADLVEAAEHTVQRFEELDAGLDLIPAQAQ